MEQYDVKIFPAAQNDLRDIVDYLNTRSPQAAVKYYDLIIERIEILRSMPNCCPLVRDAQLRLRGYRKLIVKSYIVFYVVKDEDKTVQIHRIIYGRRQYEKLL